MQTIIEQLTGGLITEHEARNAIGGRTGRVVGVTRLINGFVQVYDYASGLRACYNQDGTKRHGDLVL